MNATPYSKSKTGNKEKPSNNVQGWQIIFNNLACDLRYKAKANPDICLFLVLL